MREGSLTGTLGSANVQAARLSFSSVHNQTVKVRYQNADGSWGDYSNVINANYAYGSTCSWSRAQDTIYQAASISYTVTGANTKYVDVYRKTASVTFRYRLQNADGTYPSTYTEGTTVQNVCVGQTVSWTTSTGSSKYVDQTATGTVEQAASAASNPSDVTVSIDVPYRVSNWAVYSADNGSLMFLYSESQPTTATFGKTVTAAYAGTNGWATKTYVTASSVPWYSYRTSVRSIVFQDVVKPVSTAYWFYGFNNSNLGSVDFSMLDVSGVTSMRSMFYNCNGAAFNPDVSSWDTSSVTYMGDMFYNCYGAAFNPDVSSWDTSSVTNMASMFQNCYGAAFTSLDLSNWNTSAVTNMNSMFTGCSNLSSVTLGENFSFTGNNITNTSNKALLPTPPTTEPYTGKWVNSSIVGAQAVTAENLRDNYDGTATTGDYGRGTYVWDASTSWTEPDDTEHDDGTYVVTIPKKISYTGMSVGSVSMSAPYTVNVRGSIPSDKEVRVFAETGKSVGGDIVETTTRGKTAWSAAECMGTVNADGSLPGTDATDVIAITGNVVTVDTFTGTVQYSSELVNAS